MYSVLAMYSVLKCIMYTLYSVLGARCGSVQGNTQHERERECMLTCTHLGKCTPREMTTIGGGCISDSEWVFLEICIGFSSESSIRGVGFEGGSTRTLLPSVDR